MADSLPGPNFHDYLNLLNEGYQCAIDTPYEMIFDSVGISSKCSRRQLEEPYPVQYQDCQDVIFAYDHSNVNQDHALSAHVYSITYPSPTQHVLPNSQNVNDNPAPLHPSTVLVPILTANHDWTCTPSLMNWRNLSVLGQDGWAQAGFGRLPDQCPRRESPSPTLQTAGEPTQNNKLMQQPYLFSAISEASAVVDPSYCSRLEVSGSTSQ